MAASSWDRDLILANFQAASGNDDISSSISILESNNWNLEVALNSVFTEQEQQQENHTRNLPVVNPDPTLVSNVTGAQSFNVDKQLLFQVSWHAKAISVEISEHETVDGLKRLLQIHSGIPSSEITLEGWPSGDGIVQDNTVLSSLNLCEQTHLVLHVPAKVTVSPAKYLPCNIPDIAKSTDENSSEVTVPRAINIPRGDSEGPSTSSSEITLNVNHEGRDYRLRYNSNQTVKDVKQELFVLTKIPTRNQKWTGWPEEIADSKELGSLNLSQPDHFLMLSSKRPSVEITAVDNNRPSDSGTAGSPEDSDFDYPMMAYDDDDDTIFDTDSTQSKSLTPLLQRDSSDTLDSIFNFQHNFEDRYGEFHPVFYVGPLKDAIDEAAGQDVAQRRPLLVYLHHDGSILSNIFCSQILCSEQFVSFVSQNFVIWPWDMTHESNRQRFVNMLVLHFGNTAAGTVSKYRDGDYPLLLIVMKSKGGLEVCSILQANASLDELMMGLISGYEVFEQAKLVEIKAENERTAREAVRLEQDAAYHESLAADRAKVEAEKIKANEQLEKKKKEQIDAEIKEAKRLSCIEQLPEEPHMTESNITKIRFRFPNGEVKFRRFYEHDKLKVVFMYVASNGFNNTEYRIVTNFPRRTLLDIDLQKTLKEMKLCPQHTLFVEEV